MYLHSQYTTHLGLLINLQIFTHMELDSNTTIVGNSKRKSTYSEVQ